MNNILYFFIIVFVIFFILFINTFFEKYKIDLKHIFIKNKLKKKLYFYSDYYYNELP